MSEFFPSWYLNVHWLFFSNNSKPGSLTIVVIFLYSTLSKLRQRRAVTAASNKIRRLVNIRSLQTQHCDNVA